MKVLASLVWASVTVQICAASREASVYYLDKSTAPSNAQPPSVFPSTARLLLAQRLGLSQYHSLKNADPSTITILNSLNGPQKPLFLDEERDERAVRVLAIIEGCSKGS